MGDAEISEAGRRWGAEEPAQHVTDRRPPRYEGEDVSPTSKRELWGWYTYGFAAEVFAVCGVG